MVSSKTVSGLFFTLSIISIILLGWYWRHEQRTQGYAEKEYVLREPEFQHFLDTSVPGYLEQHAEVNFGGKAFCSYNTFGEQRVGRLIEVYMEAGCQEYYVKNGKLVAGTGEGGPKVLYINYSVDGYVILYLNQPGDGSLYTKDLTRMFPAEMYDKYQNYIENQTQVHADNKKLRDNALLYFSQAIQ